MTPKLHFPEFKDEWQLSSLNQHISTIETGVSVNADDKPARNNQFGVLKTSAVNRGKFYPLENKAILLEEVARAKLNPCKDSIIISRMNTPQLVGESGYIDREYPNLFVPDRLWMATIKDGSNAKWLSYVLSSDKMMLKINSISSGTSNSMKNISQSAFLVLQIYSPEKIEQQKIADFLTSVDDKIVALDKKVGLLKQYKQGVMQKIFSQEIRLKNENGKGCPPWVAKPLSEYVNFHRGGILSKEGLSDDGLHYAIHYGQLFTDYAEVITNVISKTNFETGIKSQYGDILMPTSDVTPQGLATASAILTEGVRLGGDINILRPKSGVNSIFLSYQLNYKKKKIMEIVSGTTIRHIYAKDLAKLKYAIPSSEIEQQKIADFLTAVDNKINLHQKELEQVKQFKKALLQRMFV